MALWGHFRLGKGRPRRTRFGRTRPSSDLVVTGFDLAAAVGAAMRHAPTYIAFARALIEVLYESYAPQTTPAFTRRVLAKHAKVLTLIEARQGARARDAMTAQLRQVHGRVLENIQIARSKDVASGG